MKTKYETMMDLTSQGVVMLHLDPRPEEVEVPKELKEGFELRLNFNHSNGARDLQISRWGVRETLRFHGDWFEVAVPWSAVKAMSKGNSSISEIFEEFAPDAPVTSRDMDQRRLDQLQQKLAKGLPAKGNFKN